MGTTQANRRDGSQNIAAWPDGLTTSTHTPYEAWHTKNNDMELTDCPFQSHLLSNDCPELLQTVLEDGDVLHRNM